MSIKCVFFALLMSALPLSAEDWPQFRGPGGQGHSAEKNLPSSWSATENVAWKRAVPGKGWSSPSLSRGRLYLTSAVPRGAGSDVSLQAICFDAKSGAPIWETDVFMQGPGAPKIHSKNSHASPTSIINGDRIYVHFGHQGLACLDLSGKILWKNNAVAYDPVHGNGGSPVLVDGLLIYSCDGASDPFVVAIDAESGEAKWKFERGPGTGKRFAFCTPLVIEVQGKKQVIIPGAGVVDALDPQTGEAIWRVQHGGYSVIPRPVFGNGLVYFSSGYDSPEVMAIRPDGRGDVTDTHVVWTAKQGAPHTPSLLLVGDELYMLADRSLVTCLDAKTGKEHWHQRVAGNYSASPIHADGKIYLQGEDGTGVVIKPGKTFEKLGDTGFPERTLASYAVGDGAIFVRTESNLYRIQK